MPSPNDIDLVVVINGQPFELTANVNEPLKAVVVKALADSKNAGQPPDNWELRDDAGALLDLAKKVGEFPFAAGAKLFLSLKAGVGG